MTRERVGQHTHTHTDLGPVDLGGEDGKVGSSQHKAESDSRDLGETHSDGAKERVVCGGCVECVCERDTNNWPSIKLSCDDSHA